MKIILSQKIRIVSPCFLGGLLLFASASPQTVLAQEKNANENASAERIAKHDLTKYAEDAAKWDQDVAKLSAGNATQGSPDTILCMGSSSFRLWDSISDDMAPFKVVRRAYGGAKFCDFAIHSPKLIEGLQFRAAMIFVANDIVGKEKDKSPEEVARLAKIVMDAVRKENPEAPIFLIAITPCPSRFPTWPTIAMANRSLEKLCTPESKTYFVATQSKYLDAKGQPMPELFVKDMLHQNKEGYAIWAGLLKESLDRNLR
jgi:hypothetical protein